MQQTTQTSSQSVNQFLTDKSSDLPSLEFDAFPSTLNELVANRIESIVAECLIFITLILMTERFEMNCSSCVQINRLILRTDDSSLESSFSTDFADRYWSLVRSGIQSVPLSPEMKKIKESVSKIDSIARGGFSSPGAISAFLVAMMLYEPGSIWLMMLSTNCLLGC